VALILLGAVAARLFLLGTQPTLSSDIYRYRWDGRVQLAGIDPYAYPPDATALQSLREEDFHQINFPQVRTVYPPLAQLAFRLGAWVSPTLTGQKGVFLAAELITVVSLLVILSLRGLSPLWVVAYAWHPLVILEVAGSGHNDALGIALLWLGLAAWHLPAPNGVRQTGGRRWFGATLAWAAAFLSKFMSVVLVGWWAFRLEARRWLVAFLLLAALPLVVWPTAVSALLESLSTMTTRVESNASVYLIFLALVGHAAVARWVSIGLWVAWLLWWGRREADPIRYLFGGLLIMALLSPAVHPWYLMWLIPFCCFWRIPAVLALTATVVLAYAVWPGYLTEGIWHLPVWARVAEYAPVVLLGFWEIRRCAWRFSFLPVTKPQVLAKP
jgi:hypothetical protein